jgi:hypothetical protein
VKLSQIDIAYLTADHAKIFRVFHGENVRSQRFFVGRFPAVRRLLLERGK